MNYRVNRFPSKVNTQSQTEKHVLCRFMHEKSRYSRISVIRQHWSPSGVSHTDGQVYMKARSPNGWLEFAGLENDRLEQENL